MMGYMMEALVSLLIVFSIMGVYISKKVKWSLLAVLLIGGLTYAIGNILANTTLIILGLTVLAFAVTPFLARLIIGFGREISE